MAIIWFIFIIFPCHCAVYMYKITILQKPLSQFPPNFTLILLLKFRNHLAEFHQISHWSFCWNVFDSLFKWSCSIDCQAHIFFFKTKNCSNDDIFISCDDRTGKMLHNICMSAVAMSLRWANCGPWASCFFVVVFSCRKLAFTFHANCLLRRQFAWNVKANFRLKIKISKCCLLKCLPSMQSFNIVSMQLCVNISLKLCK